MTLKQARIRLRAEVKKLKSIQAVADKVQCSKAAIYLYIATERVPKYPIAKRIEDEFDIPVAWWYATPRKTKAA